MPLAAAAFPVNSCSSQGSVCNLCSATLGAGALSLPYGFRHASVGVATLMLLLAGGATVYSIWLLIYVYEKTGIRTYEESTESLAGRPLRRFVEALTIVFCYGCAVAYVTAVGDVLAPLTHVFPSLSREGLMVAFWTVFMLPPSCSRVVDSLRFTSFFGMCAMVWLTVAVMWHAAAGSRHPDRPHPPPAVDVWAVRWDLLVSTPIVLFAYTCQINVFAIYDELCPQTPRAMVRVSTWGIALCFAIYFLIGLAGYADFGAQTQGNILNNYAPTLAQSSWVVQSAFVATALAITMAFPLVVHPLRYGPGTALGRAQWRSRRVSECSPTPCPHALCQRECHARSAKFWMSANTRTLVLAPFHTFLVPYQGFFGFPSI